MRMRALPPLAALVLGAATAFLVACGSSDGRIPSANASSLESALDQVSSDFDAGRCQAAEQAVTSLNGALLNLPDSVDARLRSRLRSGITHLDERVRATCGQTQTTTQQTQTQQTQTETTQTSTETTGTGTTGTDTTGTDTTGTETTGTDTTKTGTTGTDTTGTSTTGTGGGTGGTPGGDGG
jgi:hypothetical protein